MSKLQKFVIAIATQVFIILVVIFVKLLILTNGTEIMLNVLPVDPRSPLRGDYLTFQYNITRIPTYLMRDTDTLIRNGEIIYVVLDQNGKFWTPQYIQKSKPTDGLVFIKGTVTNGGALFSEARLDAFGRRMTNQEENLTVKYGIEDYFVPEGKGNDNIIFGKNTRAKVLVDGNGDAVLKQLYINEKPWP